MTASDLDAMTPLQRTIVERALALARELEATAGSAPTGQGIDRGESLLLGPGREFLRRSLEDTLQARVDALEKKLGWQSCLDRGQRDRLLLASVRLQGVSPWPDGRPAPSPARPWNSPHSPAPVRS